MSLFERKKYFKSGLTGFIQPTEEVIHKVQSIAIPELMKEIHKYGYLQKFLGWSCLLVFAGMICVSIRDRQAGETVVLFFVDAFLFWGYLGVRSMREKNGSIVRRLMADDLDVLPAYVTKVSAVYDGSGMTVAIGFYDGQICQDVFRLYDQHSRLKWMKYKKETGYFRKDPVLLVRQRDFDYYRVFTEHELAGAMMSYENGGE